MTIPGTLESRVNLNELVSDTIIIVLDTHVVDEIQFISIEKHVYQLN